MGRPPGLTRWDSLESGHRPVSQTGWSRQQSLASCCAPSARLNPQRRWRSWQHLQTCSDKRQFLHEAARQLLGAENPLHSWSPLRAPRVLQTGGHTLLCSRMRDRPPWTQYC